MRFHRLQGLQAILVFSALLPAGCAARRATVAVGPPFRLGAVYGRPVLFSPATPASTPNSAAIAIVRDGAAPRVAAPADCVAENGPFRVAPDKTHPATLLIALPSAERWIADLHAVYDPDGDAVVSLYAVLRELEQLGQNGCFAGPPSGIRDFILQSLPMEPSDSLFSYYGYRSSRSGLDLKPGMRLKVERAYLKSADTAQVAASANQEGVSFVYFSVDPANQGGVSFRRAGDVHFNPAALRKRFQGIAVESELSALPPQSEYRLVFYGLQVPKDQRLSASIIGGKSASALDQFDRELRAHPTLGCKNLRDNPAISCADFTGWATVTPQVNVVLNGKARFVDCGTPVRDVLPEGALSSLTMQRKFQTSYRDVHFKPGDSAVLSLTLVGGDRLAWAKTASAGH